MSAVAPLRPRFQDGQRLTAERLNTAFDYLRDFIRRVLLAPLSAGVAGGLTLDPAAGKPSSNLAVAPGVAIDGRGRLLLLAEARTFTRKELLDAVGGTLAAGEAIRVALALDERSAEFDPCAAHLPLNLIENVRFVFEKVSVPSVFPAFFAEAAHPNAVEAWEDLDPAGAQGSDDGITLGHVFQLASAASEIYTTGFFRQGVAPRFNVIRNTYGHPSIYLAELRMDVGKGVQTVDGVAIPDPTRFGPGPVVFTGPAGGNAVQATHVGPFAKPYAAGQYGGGPLAAGADRRVFEFAGGAGAFTDQNQAVSELGAGLGGVAATTCELDSSGGDVPRAGIPLEVGTDVAGGPVRVRRAGAAAEQPRLIGLSAGNSYPYPYDTTRTVVPVASAGLVKVVLAHEGPELAPGIDLTAADAERLRAAKSKDTVVARSAQSVKVGAPGDVGLFAWVVHPAERR